MTTATQVGLLDDIYEMLDLRGPALRSASDAVPPESELDPLGWAKTGEWLTLAHRMGAEKLFFVGDDPVIVFTTQDDPRDEAALLRSYRRAWSLSRPRFLFIATPDELRIYDLTTPPKVGPDGSPTVHALHTMERAAVVAERLAGFHRNVIESGEAFTGFDQRKSRRGAGPQLLRDVQIATEQLEEAGLDPSLAHALIERVLLARYLEDRDVLGPDYLAKVARKNARWEGLLSDPPPVPILNQERPGLLRVLADREFTYALFDQLAADFNGDLFTAVDHELDAVTGEHLELLQRMLGGDTDEMQRQLYLWAYDFSMVPTNLISSMYEQFYRAETEDASSGTYYTPPELVEFVLGEVLTSEMLERRPHLIDPACGSGIFLVEAFRMMVRYEMAKRKRRLSAKELHTVLKQFAGIDNNRAAVRLAAFSLYLAFLDFLRPQDIIRARPLPLLIDGEQTPQPVLFVDDAFTFTRSEQAQRSGELQLPVDRKWDIASFDVVVGNPPWTEPSTARGQADAWSKEFNRPVGDRNPSQRFLWRALSLLKPGGVAGLLVHANAVHSRRDTSKEFRRQWLSEVRLRKVVDFTSARKVFFEGGIAPFLFLAFSPRDDEYGTFPYESIRPSPALSATRSMAFGRLDRRLVRQGDLMVRDYLWKTFAWGSRRDAELLAALDLERPLGDLVSPVDPQPLYGYQRGPERPSARLRKLPSLHTESLQLWGPLQDAWFEDRPKGTKREPDERIYQGQRIIVTEGVKAGFGPVARLEYGELSFRHTMLCIPLQSVPQWQAEVALGCLLSSLGRYRMFMTSSQWGLWRDKVRKEDVLNTPVRLPGASDPAVQRIRRAVHALRGYIPARPQERLKGAERPQLPDKILNALERLDEGVFELFKLVPAQRDLVRDFMDNQLDLARRGSNSASLTRIEMGTLENGGLPEAPRGLARYLEVFLGRWNRELEPTGQLEWSVHVAKSVPVLCAVFRTRAKGEPTGGHMGDPLEGEVWEQILVRLESAVERPVTRTILVNGVVRSVSATEIIIAKRDERRLWTATAAHEDVEATMLRVMALRGR